jgi:hypothetical protein
MSKFYVNSIEGRLASAQDYLHDKYHSGKLTIPDSHDTGMHGGDPHASDGIITNGDYLSMDGGKTWVHNERAIR